MRQTKEERLVRNARRALAKLMAYREEHAAKTAARDALDDVTATLRLSQWPPDEARRIARRLLAAGVTPVAARVMFSESESRVQ
jgi:hypothetical protein